VIIDTHVHVWALDEQHQPPKDGLFPPPQAGAPVEWLFDDMAAFGIDHCVLIQMSSMGWDISYVVECLERYPGRFKAIGLVNPLDPNNADHLRAAVKRGLSGVRLHPLYYPDRIWVDSPEHDALWNAADDTGAILQFHMLPEHAVPLARMIARHPTVRVIVDHIGKPDVTEPSPHPSFDPVLRLADFPNVWAKIGDYQVASRQSFPWRDTVPFVAALRRAYGAERMIWGTGFPSKARLVPLRQAIEYVRQYLPCLSSADVDRILGETPRALFGF
jgi:L-fuconolactonase